MELNLDELTDRQRYALALMQQLRRDEAAWRSARLIVIGGAAELVDAGELELSEVCAALEVSPSTWVRRRAELRAYLAGQSGDAARALGDQAAAGARGLGLPDPDGGSDA